MLVDPSFCLAACSDVSLGDIANPSQEASATDVGAAWLEGKPEGSPPFGRGSKLNHQGTTGFGPCCHLSGFHFGYLFLTHSHFRATYLGLNSSYASKPQYHLRSKRVLLPVSLMWFPSGKRNHWETSKHANYTCQPGCRVGRNRITRSPEASATLVGHALNSLYMQNGTWVKGTGD